MTYVICALKIKKLFKMHLLFRYLLTVKNQMCDFLSKSSHIRVYTLYYLHYTSTRTELAQIPREHCKKK